MRNLRAIVWTMIIGLSVATVTRAADLPTDAFQLRYASNLNVGDSVVNISNGGTLSGADPAGNVCVNVYAFDPTENMIACCSCRVSPNGLVSLSARSDLISNTLTPALPNSIVIKLLATEPSGGTCNASLPASPDLAPGMRAWGTTLHANPTSPVTYSVTETDFAKAQLSDSELTSLTDTCGFIQAEGGGFGICRSCRLGGL
ncbi:MAG: hypothetical protein ABI629_05035 [bacterium]